MKILVVNAGSSSLKYQLLDMTDESVIAKGNCDRIGIDDFITIQVGNGQRDSTEEIDYTDAPELLPEEQMEEVGDVDEFQEIHE